MRFRCSCYAEQPGAVVFLTFPPSGCGHVPNGGLVRFIPGSCYITKVFKLSDVYKGTLKFKTDSKKIDGSYRTLFLPQAHNGRIYKNSNQNLVMALSRLFACRPNEEELRRQQGSFRKKRFFARQLRHLREYFRDEMLPLEGYHRELRFTKSLDQSHSKFRLRVDALHEIFRDGLGSITGFIKKVACKLKTNEIAKVGKAPRLIFDLTTVGSLAGVYLAYAMKKVFATYRGNNEAFQAEFVSSPDQDTMRAVFQKLLRQDWISLHITPMIRVSESIVLTRGL